MTPRRLLVVLSSAQLAAGLVGLAVAVRRRVPYDIPQLHGRPEHVRRDALTMGTAYSAPAPMLAARATAIARLAAGPSDGARRALGGLGLAGAMAVLGHQARSGE